MFSILSSSCSVTRADVSSQLQANAKAAISFTTNISTENVGSMSMLLLISGLTQTVQNCWEQQYSTVELKREPVRECSWRASEVLPESL